MTRRFAAVGNGWTVDVIAYILGHIRMSDHQIEDIQ